MARLSFEDMLGAQGSRRARSGYMELQRTTGTGSPQQSQPPRVTKGKSLSGAAQEAGVSISTVRSYLSKGWLQPDREPIAGGYRYSFRQRDIDRLTETVAANLDWLAAHRPGLTRYFEQKALEQGRRLPQSTGGRS